MGEIVFLFKVSGAITAIMIGGLFAFSVANDSVDNFFDVMGIKTGGVYSQDLPKEIHSALNDYRISKGLSALTWDSKLASVAKQHSENMAILNQVSHVISGHDVGDRLRMNGYHCKIQTFGNFGTTGGENLISYQGVLSAQEIIELWISSPSHNEVLLSDYWKNSGIGIANNNELTFVTHNFC